MEVMIRDKKLDIPLIQGGMGVGISMGKLAGAVAAEGGMGTISAAGIGFREPDFDTDFPGANARALKKEIALAKSISKGRGIIAVNIMTAMNYFEESVRAAVEGGADAIVSGAGLPKNLPQYTKGSDVMTAPVVSSARAASVICRLWDRHYNAVPDFVIIEGSEAGGHLGFDADELNEGHCETLDDILPEVKKVLIPFEEKYGRHIPVFVAGGIRTSEEIRHYINEGADGVQLATIFTGTEECDASPEYKQIMINAGNDDIRIVKSPVGMPGRAIETPLIRTVLEGNRIQPESCRRCIKTCNPAETVYCISNALISAWYGDYEKGLFFCGSDVDCIKDIRTVKDVIDSLL
jgi:NAD(P)H-dependent flavin oxidoreductase YrpB (nitropropane dioxygenase family)